MSLEFRPCTRDDSAVAIPLMFSAGPEAFRYVFSVEYQDQAFDFLHHAFLRGGGEFGYRGHLLAEEDGKPVALVGVWHPKENMTYTLDAVKQIFAYYGPAKGLIVVIRGLRFEKIVSPPRKGTLCLHNLGVARELRGKGIGGKVIDHFFELARKRGVDTISLDVAETNPRAKALYERMGFSVVRHNSGGQKNQYGSAVSHDYMEARVF
ncbi:MAG: GNAT family N-acetyltransferase [Pseudomonadales bacterium]